MLVLRRVFFRRRRSPLSQRWQKEHNTPAVQPTVCTNAQGLQFPEPCPAEPTVGISGAAGSATGIVDGCDVESKSEYACSASGRATGEEPGAALGSMVGIAALRSKTNLFLTRLAEGASSVIPNRAKMRSGSPPASIFVEEWFRCGCTHNVSAAGPGTKWQRAVSAQAECGSEERGHVVKAGPVHHIGIWSSVGIQESNSTPICAIEES